MKKKNLIACISLMIAIVSMIVIIKGNRQTESVYFKDYILNVLHEENNSDYDAAGAYVTEKLEDNNLSSKEQALNLLARDSYYFMNMELNEFLKTYKVTEQQLKKNEMYEEVVFLYSMVSSTYLDRYEYEKAYLYINEAELITTYLYNKTQDPEVLSSLLAIMYLKSNLEMSLNLESEATKTFEHAETLRESSLVRERVDIYKNMASYYYKKQNYDQAQKYGLAMIKILEQSSVSQTYQHDFLFIQMMLANSFLAQGNIDECLNIIEEYIKTEEMIKNHSDLLFEQYNLYANVYLYYDQYEKAVESLQAGYEAIVSTKDDLSKRQVVNRIIDVSNEQEIEIDIILWYERLRELNGNKNEAPNNQFLLSQIINSEYAKARVEIEMLEIGRRIERAEILALIVVVLITLNQVRLLYKKNRTDFLTGIYNRNYFNTIYQRYMNNKKSHHLIIFDIDNFKILNDTYGHPFGDLVLERIGHELKEIKNHHIKPFRYGGEEFVLLVDKKYTDKVIEITEQLRHSIQNIHFDNGVVVTISVGVSQYTEQNPNTLKEADQKLYVSKTTGKNKVTF